MQHRRLRIGVFDEGHQSPARQAAEIAIALGLVEGVLGRAGEAQRGAGSLQGVAELIPRPPTDHPLGGEVIGRLAPDFPDQQQEPAERRQQSDREFPHGVLECTHFGGARASCPRLEAHGAFVAVGRCCAVNRWLCYSAAMSPPAAANPFVPGRGQMPPYLAGREREQKALISLLAYLKAGRGAPRDAVLSGPRGNGKTALLRWMFPRGGSRWRHRCRVADT